MRNLGLAEFIILCSVSRDNRASIKDRLTSITRNVNLQFKRFFNEPKAFQCIQAQTDALIAGEFARAFFGGSTRSFNKLLIYVGGANSLPIFEAYLDSNGLTATNPKGTGNYDAAEQYSCCYAVYREENVAQDALWIYTKLSKGGFHDESCCKPEPCTECDQYYPPIGRIVEQQRFTAALNIVSSGRAYALYPRTTFIENKSYVIGYDLDQYMDQDSIRAEAAALRAAGVQKAVTNLLYNDDFIGAQARFKPVRRVGDERTWIIDLDTTDIDCTSSPHTYNLESTTFKLHKGYYWFRSANYYAPVTEPYFEYGIPRRTKWSSTAEAPTNMLHPIASRGLTSIG
jgi:hypothetical protein